MRRQIMKITAVLVLLAMLPAALLLCGFLLPSYYQESYYAELYPMYRRLYDTEGRKLVILGGSNVAFGVDTALLESLLREKGYDYTVCPFGLYAAVGTSVMLELSQDALKEGDIVVLALEPVSETMSGYFGATAFWKCAEDAPQMLGKTSSSQKAALAGNYISYLQERYSIRRNGNPPKAEGAYARVSFDESCNMIFERSGNAMALGFDTASPVDLSAVEVGPEFSRQVNDYCQEAEAKGASVWFSFSPVNRSALADGFSESAASFFRLCNETFFCPMISDPNDYILDSGWFYDSNFHLNSAGAQLRTCLLAEDILAQLGCYAPVEYSVPAMPGSIAQVETNGTGTGFFTFEAVNGGYLVSGLTESGMSQPHLTVPVSYEGKPVVGITGDAFAENSVLTELILPESIESLPDGVFQNCGSLLRLVLEHQNTTCKVTEHTFDGAEQLRFYVPADSYHLYRDGAGCEANPWSIYLDRIFTF